MQHIRDALGVIRQQIAQSRFATHEICAFVPNCVQRDQRDIMAACRLLPLGGEGNCMKIVLGAIIALLLPSAALGRQATAVPSPSPAPQASSPSPVGPATLVVVPGGTPVTVNFLQSVSSDSETQGATVPVEATREVDINGMEVIAKGAQGQATLTTVRHSGGNGSGGQIKFNVDWIYSVDGGKIQLSPVNNATPNADRKGEASTLGILGWATFGLLGLFSHNLAHGNAAILKPDKTFTVFVDHTVHVRSRSIATAPPGYDH